MNIFYKLTQANFYRDMEEAISGTVLTDPIPSYGGELHVLDPLRSTHGAPSQHSGRNH